MTDLMKIAIERTRREMAKTPKTKPRIHALWAGARMARTLAVSDVVQSEFMRLAIETGLISSGGFWTGDDVRRSVRRFGEEDVRHVVDWALSEMNPYETGPLR